MAVIIEANTDVLLLHVQHIATIHCCPFEDNNAHVCNAVQRNAKFLEPVFQLSLASLKCLGILVFNWNNWNCPQSQNFPKLKADDGDLGWESHKFPRRSEVRES